MSQSVSRLILFPTDSHYMPDDAGALITTLQNIGLVAEPLSLPDRYAAGEKFLQLVIFLGCSPAVDFAPPQADSEKFCHVRIASAQPQLQFCGSALSTRVYCPHCRYEEKNWSELITAWQQQPDAYQYACPECGEQSEIPAMNWRKSAGFARQFIEIFNVYPNEAVPADALLNALQQASGVTWKYFYVR